MSGALFRPEKANTRVTIAHTKISEKFSLCRETFS
jgi:hypothetical protein